MTANFYLGTRCDFLRSLFFVLRLLCPPLRFFWPVRRPVVERFGSLREVVGYVLVCFPPVFDLCRSHPHPVRQCGSFRRIPGKKKKLRRPALFFFSLRSSSFFSCFALVLGQDSLIFPIDPFISFRLRLSPSFQGVPTFSSSLC